MVGRGDQHGVDIRAIAQIAEIFIDVDLLAGAIEHVERAPGRDGCDPRRIRRPSGSACWESAAVQVMPAAEVPHADRAHDHAIAGGRLVVLGENGRGHDRGRGQCRRRSFQEGASRGAERFFTAKDSSGRLEANGRRDGWGASQRPRIPQSRGPGENIPGTNPRGPPAANTLTILASPQAVCKQTPFAGTDATAFACEMPEFGHQSGYSVPVGRAILPPPVPRRA